MRRSHLIQEAIALVVVVTLLTGPFMVPAVMTFGLWVTHQLKDTNAPLPVDHDHYGAGKNAGDSRD